MAHLSVHLKQDQDYTATIELSGLNVAGTNTEVAARLTAVGFKKVTVSGSLATRMARGTWGMPTQKANIMLPNGVNIKDIKEAKAIPTLG